MNRFLYFVPGAVGCSLHDLRGVGLADRFEDNGCVAAFGVTAWKEGPGGAGCAVALAGPAVEFSPQSQLWTNCGRFWIGVEREAMPGPADLLRTISFEGYLLTLLDHREWQIPLLSTWNAGRGEYVSKLPKALRCYVDSGHVTVKPAVRPQYERLQTIADTILTACLSGVEWEAEGVFFLAIELLKENYRLGVDEVGILGLFDEAHALMLLKVSIDTPSLDAAAADLASQDELRFADDPTSIVPPVETAIQDDPDFIEGDE